MGPEYALWLPLRNRVRRAENHLIEWKKAWKGRKLKDWKCGPSLALALVHWKFSAAVFLILLFVSTIELAKSISDPTKPTFDCHFLVKIVYFCMRVCICMYMCVCVCVYLWVYVCVIRLTIYKHESDKNMKFLSIGNFGVLYVVVYCCLL